MKTADDCIGVRPGLCGLQISQPVPDGRLLAGNDFLQFSVNSKGDTLLNRLTADITKTTKEFIGPVQILVETFQKSLPPTQRAHIPVPAHQAAGNGHGLHFKVLSPQRSRATGCIDQVPVMIIELHGQAGMAEKVYVPLIGRDEFSPCHQFQPKKNSPDRHQHQLR